MPFTIGQRSQNSWMRPLEAFQRAMEERKREQEIKEAQKEAEQAQMLQAGLSIGGMALGAGIGGLAAGSIAGAGLGASLGSTAGGGIAQMISPTPGGGQQVARSAQGAAGDLMSYGMAQERKTSAKDWDAFQAYGMTMTDAQKWAEIHGTTPEMELLSNQSIMAQQSKAGAGQLVSELVQGAKSAGFQVSPTMTRGQQHRMQEVMRGVEESNADLDSGAITWPEHVDELAQYRKKAMGIMGAFSINPKQPSPQERWQQSTFVGEDGITRGFDRNNAPKIIHEPEGEEKQRQAEQKATEAANKQILARGKNLLSAEARARSVLAGTGEEREPTPDEVMASARAMWGNQAANMLPQQPVPPQQQQVPPFLAQQPDPAQIQRIRVQQYHEQM